MDQSKDLGRRGLIARLRVGAMKTGAVTGAVVMGGAASLVIASAHHVIGTTSLCGANAQPCGTASWPTGTTAVSDSANVNADSTRKVKFFLWGPGACGTGTPVFTDLQNVLTSNLTDSTVTSNTFTPTVDGTYEWTVQILAPNGSGGWNVENSEGCGVDTPHESVKLVTTPGGTPSPSPSISPSPSASATPSPSPSSSATPSPTPIVPGGPSPSNTVVGGVGGVTTPGTGSEDLGNLSVGGLLILGGPAVAMLGVLGRGYMRRRRQQ